MEDFTPPGTEANVLKPGNDEGDNMIKADSFTSEERPLLREFEKKQTIKRGNPRLNADDRFLQGTHMLARRVLLNETIAQIAQQFGLSPGAVSQRLAAARTADLTQVAKDIVVERLMPKAIAVVDVHLSEGSYEAAKDVLFGSGVLQKQAKTEVHHSSSPTLDQIRAERNRKRVIDVKPSGDSGTASQPSLPLGEGDVHSSEGSGS